MTPAFSWNTRVKLLPLIESLSAPARDRHVAIDDELIWRCAELRRRWYASVIMRWPAENRRGEGNRVVPGSGGCHNQGLAEGQMGRRVVAVVFVDWIVDHDRSRKSSRQYRSVRFRFHLHPQRE